MITTLKKQVAGLIRDARSRLSRPALDPEEERYAEFLRGKWSVRKSPAGAPVVLTFMFHWRPSIHALSYCTNDIADASGAVIRAFDFNRHLGTGLCEIYAAFGAELGMSLDDARKLYPVVQGQAERLTAAAHTKWDVLSLSADGILLGDLIYDTYLRRYSEPTVEPGDPRLTEVVTEALAILRVAKEWFSQQRVICVFVDHLVYNACGILVRVAGEAGVPVIVLGTRPRLNLNKLSWMRTAEGFLMPIRHRAWEYRRLFSTLSPEKQARALLKGRLTIENRLAGKKQVNVLPENSAYESNRDLMVLEKSDRPKVVVFLHDFCDAAHGDRFLLFPDYLEWARFLFAEAAKSPFDWYVKPHPNNRTPKRGDLNNGNARAMDLLRTEFPHMRYLSPAVSNRQLVDEGVCAAFTMYGTVGHEMPYLGIPVVNAGDNRHVAYKFNYHPQSIEELRGLITHADELKVHECRDEIAEFCYMHFHHQNETHGCETSLLPPEVLEAAYAGDAGLFDRLIASADVGEEQKFATYIAEYHATRIAGGGIEILPDITARIRPAGKINNTIMNWKNSVVLVTGGTGSFGQQFVRALLKEKQPKKIIVFSRDELKQHDMRNKFSPEKGGPIRYFIGDVRDRDRLQRAFHGVDIVVHAAALKQVPACEYNPIEAIKTNIEGGKNVIEAALDQGVKHVLALSTDKAVNPVNLYGATKLCAEKLFVQANAYSGEGGTKFSCVRYGNVVGSRGSVIPLFVEQRKTGKITVTDPRMTRFWITLTQGVKFVINCIDRMHGGEVFIPKIPSMNIMDLARAIAPECEVANIGIRPGEKLHEALFSEDEARDTLDVGDMYVVQPSHQWWNAELWKGTALKEGFCYSSDKNTEWLTLDQLKEMAGVEASAPTP